MMLASPPLKSYFLKLADAKVDVLSSINQRLRENKGKEGRSLLFPRPANFIHSKFTRLSWKFSRLLKRGYISLLCNGAQKYISEVKLDPDDGGPEAKEHKECLRSPSLLTFVHDDGVMQNTSRTSSLARMNRIYLIAPTLFNVN